MDDFDGGGTRRGGGIPDREDMQVSIGGQGLAELPEFDSKGLQVGRAHPGRAELEVAILGLAQDVDVAGARLAIQGLRDLRQAIA